MSGDHNQYQRDEENISYMYTLPEQGALRISTPLPDPQITWGHSNTSEIWARVDKDLNVTHLDLDLCFKGPDNEYTALAKAIWNKAIEEAAKVCDEIAADYDGSPAGTGADNCATAIRARGEK